jgi:hypothetical protein
MKAKLKKENSQYNLYLDNDMIASTYPYQNQKMLSRQNCDDIFGVVDVEKLAEEDCSIHHPYHPVHDQTTRATFIRGFNKAMELNKDKVFTLEDIKMAMRIVFDWSEGDNHSECTSLNELLDKFQSIQQPTEIEVEVEMEEEFIFDPAMGISQGYYSEKPKLDSNGCLILKKI